MGSESDLISRVAEIFDAAGWSPEVERVQDGLQLDVFAASPQGFPVVIECKAFQNLVGLRTAREFATVVGFLRETRKHLGAWLVTTSGFTPNAREELRRNQIEALTVHELTQRLQPQQTKSGARNASQWRQEVDSARKGSRRVFVIMPFDEEMLDVFLLGIRWAANEVGAVAERADDLAHNGEIIEEVRRAIKEYDVVVADTSGANANVCYEIGFAHALEKASRTSPTSTNQ
jgi:hypothetical protein